MAQLPENNNQMNQSPFISFAHAHVNQVTNVQQCRGGGDISLAGNDMKLILQIMDRIQSPAQQPPPPPPPQHQRYGSIKSHNDYRNGVSNTGYIKDKVDDTESGGADHGHAAVKNGNNSKSTVSNKQKESDTETYESTDDDDDDKDNDKDNEEYFRSSKTVKFKPKYKRKSAASISSVSTVSTVSTLSRVNLNSHKASVSRNHADQKIDFEEHPRIFNPHPVRLNLSQNGHQRNDYV